MFLWKRVAVAMTSTDPTVHQAPRSRRRGPIRVVAEVAIIVVGVLIALARGRLARGGVGSGPDSSVSRRSGCGSPVGSAGRIRRSLEPDYLPAQAIARTDSLIVILGDPTFDAEPATVLRFLREQVYLLWRRRAVRHSTTW